MLPPTYLFIAVVLMAVLHFLVPVRVVIGVPWRLLGILTLLLGLTLNILADRSFKQHKTTVRPFQESSALVTSGVFRISRHPMYLGMILIVAGIALLLGSLTPWVVIPALAVVLDVLFIRKEESMLETTFGAAYREYKSHVPRWVGR